SSDDENDDVGGLGTTGTHLGERGVTGGIEEGDHAAVGLHVVGTDVLGDATRLTGSHLGTTDVVEQRGLAMVDVPHHGHDRSTGYCLAFELQGLGQRVFQRVVADQLDLVAQLFGNQLSSFL